MNASWLIISLLFSLQTDFIKQTAGSTLLRCDSGPTLKEWLLLLILLFILF